MQIYLSHAHEDREEAVRLAAELRDLGFRVWVASEEILPGDNWGRELGRALEESDAMVVLLSPWAAKSQWVEYEIQYALTNIRFENRVIPVRMKRSAHVPWILRSGSVIWDDACRTAAVIAERLGPPTRKKVRRSRATD